MYNKILVPLDGSDLAECVLPHVESIAQGCGAKSIVLMSVTEPFRMISGGDSIIFSDEDIKRINSEHRSKAESYLDNVASRLKAGSTSVSTRVSDGKAADMLADYATKNEVDLIIVATHGHSGISRWFLGSVADRLVRTACVPVLVVRAPGCEPHF